MNMNKLKSRPEVAPRSTEQPYNPNTQPNLNQGRRKKRRGLIAIAAAGGAVLAGGAGAVIGVAAANSGGEAGSPAQETNSNIPPQPNFDPTTGRVEITTTNQDNTPTTDAGVETTPPATNGEHIGIPEIDVQKIKEEVALKANMPDGEKVSALSSIVEKWLNSGLDDETARAVLKNTPGCDFDAIISGVGPGASSYPACRQIYLDYILKVDEAYEEALTGRTTAFTPNSEVTNAVQFIKQKHSYEAELKILTVASSDGQQKDVPHITVQPGNESTPSDMRLIVNDHVTENPTMMEIYDLRGTTPNEKVALVAKSLSYSEDPDGQHLLISGLN